MSGAKVLGLISMLLSIPLILAGVIYLFSESDQIPQIFQDDRDLSGYIALGGGVFLLILGVIFMLMRPKQTPVVVQPVAAPAPQQVEIKRSEMNWGASAPRAKSSSEELQDQLEGVNQKISRIKVQYGMGELSSESYRTLTQQYEQEKAAIEKKIIDQQGI